LDRPDQTERFYQVIWPHAAMVLRAAVVLCRNNAEADDLAQETMLKAFKGLSTLREGGEVKAWLMRILRNCRIDRLRRSVVETESLLGDEVAAKEMSDSASNPSAWENPHALLEAFSDAQVISAIKRLPEEMSWTLLLVDVEGLTHEDAAEILGIPEGTVKSRAHRGRQLLRSALMPLAKELRIVP
jgi:RNA polymerase sigma-70 factor (ECF subfamily)